MDRHAREPASYLPLSPHDLQVLLILAEEPLHGYGIVKASLDQTGRPALDLGSLYRIIRRMKRAGLIEEVAGPPPDTKRQRRLYKATGLGRAVAKAEVRRLRALLGGTGALRLLEER